MGKEHTDPQTGRPFYYHAVSKSTTWYRPDDGNGGIETGQSKDDNLDDDHDRVADHDNDGSSFIEYEIRGPGARAFYDNLLEFECVEEGEEYLTGDIFYSEVND